MKKKLHRSAPARKVKMKAALVKGDQPTEMTTIVIPAGSLVEWAGSRRSSPQELNVTWNGETYAMRRDHWDAGQEVDDEDDSDDQEMRESPHHNGPRILRLSVEEVQGWLDGELSGEELRAKLKAKLSPKEGE